MLECLDPSSLPASEHPSSRLLKKAHLRCWRARAALRRTDQVRLAPAPILRMGTRRAALHLDLFKQPGQKRVFQHPARPSHNDQMDDKESTAGLQAVAFLGG